MCGQEPAPVLADQEILPPRARDRDVRTVVEWYGESIQRRFGRIWYRLPSYFIGGTLARSTNWGAAFPLFFSLILPGSGQMINGQPGLGIAAMMLTAVFTYLGFISLFAPFFLYLFIAFGFLLLCIHYHAYWVSVSRAGGMSPPLTGVALTFLLLAVIYVQLFGFSTIVERNRTAVDLYVDSFQPVFARGDRMLLVTNPRVNDLVKGDIVMVNTQFMERVIALPGECFEVRQQVVLVDGKPQIEKGFEPFTAGNQRLRFFPPPTELARIQASPPETTLAIPPENIGVLRDGKPVVIPVQTLFGRVDSIVWPSERRLQLPRRK